MSGVHVQIQSCLEQCFNIVRKAAMMEMAIIPLNNVVNRDAIFVFKSL